MPTTAKRRTTRIAQPKPRPSYEGVVLARVLHKKTGAFLCYLAKPSKPVDAKGGVLPWYHVTKDAAGGWRCNCDATVECKHVIAAKELDVIHEASHPQEREELAQEEPAQAPQPVPVSFEVRRQAKVQTAKSGYDDMPKGDLHGTQHRGGFMAACFGSSPEMSQYRERFAARVAK